MFQKSDVIGVMDSGVGGLTVVKELQKLLPNENFVFYGDSANCPYGNREQIVLEGFTKGILNFLKSHQCKIVAIACNTMSALVQQVQDDFDFEIIGIIEPAAVYIAKIKPRSIGVVATEFTVKTQKYNQLIHAHAPAINVFGQGSKTLAALIENGSFNYTEIDAEIKHTMDALLAKDPNLTSVVLGCTHYPIVLDRFELLYPNIHFINPAQNQAEAIKEALEKADLINPSKTKGRFDIFTSGDTKIFELLVKKLDLSTPDHLTHQKIQ